MRAGFVLALLGLALTAGCTPYVEPPPRPQSITTVPPPPITGTVVVQPDP